MPDTIKILILIDAETLYNSLMFIPIHDRTGTQKVISCVSWQSARPRKPVIHYYPKVIQIQITDVCNLDCTFCGFRQREYASGIKVPKKEISPHVLQWLSNDVLSNVKLYLTGNGEPLTSALFWEFIEGKRPSAGLTFNTNGILLTKTNRARLLSYPKEIILTVSLNACTPQTYKRIMGKDAFDKICEHVAQLKKEIAKSASTIQLLISYATIKENLSEMSLLPDIAKQLGAQQICCFLAEQYEDYTKGWFSSGKQFIRRNPALLQQFNKQLKKVEKQAGDMGIKTWSSESNDAIWQGCCNEVFDYMGINKDGSTYACCRCSPPPSTGNIKDHATFWDLWNNMTHQNLRAGFLMGVFSPPCQNMQCPYWRAQRSSNQRATPWYNYAVENLETSGFIKRDTLIISHKSCIMKGTVTNTGRAPWNNSIGENNTAYQVGMKLFRSKDETTIYREFRSSLKAAIIKPKETTPFKFMIDCEHMKKGDYIAVIDVVKEGSYWMEERGTTPVRIKLSLKNDFSCKKE